MFKKRQVMGPVSSKDMQTPSLPSEMVQFPWKMRIIIVQCAETSEKSIFQFL